ncbi:Protein of unknown function (DUF3040) [Prauserella shujinwangii]|uniref:DUF3040 family protein n=1 Tax=Prauserella shujinwangii TaxID=1453103 RepID=A0A2T0LU81_9PSEU|nr:DUF3040 domain-containing protein [Prauserella shujinwangii]PRX47299.1 Protein of unknown function (DUF3040) [Prauserella shujinwangii]
MALRDEEQRQLAEIEQRLVEDDPHLAQRLAKLRPFALGRAGLVVLSVVAALVVGLIVIATGSELDSPALVVLGAALAAGVPTAVIWRLWLRKLR